MSLNIIDNADNIQNYLNTKSSKQVNTNSNTNTFTNVGSDFKSILAQQNNSSKTNKLSQSNEYNNSSYFQL